MRISNSRRLHKDIYNKERIRYVNSWEASSTLIRGSFISIHDGGSLMESCNWKLFLMDRNAFHYLLDEANITKRSFPIPLQILSRQFVEADTTIPTKLIPFGLRFIDINEYDLSIDDLNFSFNRAKRWRVKIEIDVSNRYETKSVNYIKKKINKRIRKRTYSMNYIKN